MKYVLVGFVSLCMSITILIVLHKAITRNEYKECVQLRQLESTHVGFYWTDWQIEMCNQYE